MSNPASEDPGQVENQEGLGESHVEPSESFNLQSKKQRHDYGKYKIILLPAVIILIIILLYFYYINLYSY